MKSIFLNNFKSTLTVILTGLILSLSSCADSVSEPVVPEPDGDGLTITGSLNISCMPLVTSRGNIGPSQGSGMFLTIFEFDKGSDDAHSFLKNIYRAEITSTTTAVPAGDEVHFKFTLKAATNAKELHFFVTDQYLTSDQGSVASIIPSLTVGSPGNEKEAYWGRLIFDYGYTDTTDPESTPEFLPGVIDQFKGVPVIRNFARISLGLSEVAAQKLELYGFALVNVPTSGTIAPWNKDENKVPDLLLYENNEYEMKSYSDITGDEEGQENYSGFVPGQATFRNIEAEIKLPGGGYLSNATKYMYEHPYESSRRTYLIVQGKYYLTGKTGFYKLDIGNYNNTDGKFVFYDIIRNIDYNITIDDVLAEGTSTIEEAIARAPFNNLSAATETSSMLNVSDGQNMLIVNDTNHIIITEDQKIDILYRYLTDISTDSEATNNDLYNEDTGEGYVTVQVGPGSVIKSWKVLNVDETDDDGIAWRRIEITPNPPSSTLRTQSITITNRAGLSRTINLVLRTPWQYAVIYSAGGKDYYATVAPGVENIYQDKPLPVSAKAGEPLTVYFNLPNGLSEAMFPLEFKLEAIYQGVENNKIGTLVVSTGPSLFDPNVTAISYIKTVSYQEYEYMYKNDGSNDINVNVKNTNHTVRCRFLTIIDEAVDDAEIRIHNDYFVPDASVVFERK